MKKVDIIACFIIGGVSALILPKVPVFSGLFDLIGKYIGFFPLTLPFFAALALYIAEIISKKMPTIFQIAKSFLAGILNTAIDLGIFDFLTGFFAIARGWPTIAFKIASFGCASINSYFWNKHWAFQKKGTEKAGKEFLQFLLVTLGGLLIHVSVIHVVVNLIGPKFGIEARTWASVGNMVAVFFGFSWNFLGYKLLVFKK